MEYQILLAKLHCEVLMGGEEAVLERGGKRGRIWQVTCVLSQGYGVQRELLQVVFEDVGA